MKQVPPTNCKQSRLCNEQSLILLMRNPNASIHQRNTGVAVMTFPPHCIVTDNVPEFMICLYPMCNAQINTWMPAKLSNTSGGAFYQWQQSDCYFCRCCCYCGWWCLDCYYVCFLWIALRWHSRAKVASPCTVFYIPCVALLTRQLLLPVFLPWWLSCLLQWYKDKPQAVHRPHKTY